MKKLKLKNVKAFGCGSEIELKPITLVVGENSSGKSSLIRFPVVLSQTLEEDIMTPLLLFGNKIDYGNYRDVVNNESGKSIEFGYTLSWKDIARYRPNTMRNSGKERKIKVAEEISINVSIENINRKLNVTSFELLFDNKIVLNLKRNKTNDYFIRIQSKSEEYSCHSIKLGFEKYFPNIRNLVPEIFYNIVNNHFNEDNRLSFEEILKFTNVRKRLLRPDINVLDYLNQDSDYENFNTKNLEYFDNICDNLEECADLIEGFKRYSNIYFKSVSYIGPFRNNPERIYRDSENTFKNVGISGEHTSSLLRQNQLNNSKLLSAVSEWFKSAINCEIEIEEIVGSNLYTLKVVDQKTGVSSNLLDAGYGISQVLPIVTQIFSTPTDYKRRKYGLGRKELIIVEQPELHLHPAAQSHLAALMSNRVIEDKNCSIVIETHSEHLIRKLQVLVANPENQISNDDIAIYYVHKIDADNMKIQKMELNEFGQFIEPWPSGFFDKNYELSKELLMHARRR